jgi:hypothetical protein
MSKNSKSNSQFTPTVDQLRAMVPHIEYEIDGFRRGFCAWNNLNPQSLDRNWTVESARLHFRVLQDFFSTAVGNRYQDSILAADYIAGWKRKVRPPIKEIVSQVHKRLAHLTATRLRTETWRVGEMEDWMELQIKAFMTALGDEQASWFASVPQRRNGCSR